MGGLEDRAREQVRQRKELLAAYEVRRRREQAQNDAAEKAKKAAEAALERKLRAQLNEFIELARRYDEPQVEIYSYTCKTTPCMPDKLLTTAWIVENPHNSYARRSAQDTHPGIAINEQGELYLFKAWRTFDYSGKVVSSTFVRYDGDARFSDKDGYYPGTVTEDNDEYLEQQSAA